MPIPLPNPKRQRVVVVDDPMAVDRLLTSASTDTDADAPLWDRINTLDDRVQQVAGGLAYVAQNSTDLRGAFGSRTVRQVATALHTAEDSLTRMIERLHAYAATLQNFANRQVLDPAAGHQAGDGNCYLTFVNVGAGDCTLITTPLGTRIMIDCGSDSQSDVIFSPDLDPSVTGKTPLQIIGDTITASTFLNGRPTVDLLFLTHPDADHYNLLRSILEPIPGMAVLTVYYGGTEDFSAFREDGTSGFLRTVANDLCHKVIVCDDPYPDDDAAVVTRTIDDKALTTNATVPNTLGTAFVDQDGSVVVYHEQDYNGVASDFRIAVLAGNASGVWVGHQFITRETSLKRPSEPTIDSTDNNRRSLVLLVQCFGQTLLVTGDATVVTETFVVNTFRAALQGVGRVRMGHHGSPTSSSQAFLQAMPNLDTAIASTSGKTTVGHRLPKVATLNSYLPKVQDGAGAHDIYAFDIAGTGGAQLYYSGITKRLFATGSNGPVQFVLSPPAPAIST